MISELGLSEEASSYPFYGLLKLHNGEVPGEDVEFSLATPEHLSTSDHSRSG